MGNLISVVYACITLTLMNLATNDHSYFKLPAESFKIVENEILTVFVDSDEAFDFFSEAGYDTNKKAMVFSTSEETVQIRVYDHLQTLVYQLPVRSNKIRILAHSKADLLEYLKNF